VLVSLGVRKLIAEAHATDAPVKTFGHAVLDEFLDQVAKMSLSEVTN
jgi:hypothetical protein